MIRDLYKGSGGCGWVNLFFFPFTKSLPHTLVVLFSLSQRLLRQIGGLFRYYWAYDHLLLFPFRLVLKERERKNVVW